MCGSVPLRSLRDFSSRWALDSNTNHSCFGLAPSAQSICQAQLEGHIEPRGCGRIAIQLDSRQIVKGIPASPNQLDDSLESSSRTGNLDGRARSQAECAESGDECQVQRLVVPVVRDIEECGFLLSALAHRATSLEPGRLASRS